MLLCSYAILLVVSVVRLVARICLVPSDPRGVAHSGPMDEYLLYYKGKAPYAKLVIYIVGHSYNSFACCLLLVVLNNNLAPYGW